jgi:hypothetical protein
MTQRATIFRQITLPTTAHDLDDIEKPELRGADVATTRVHTGQRAVRHGPGQSAFGVVQATPTPSLASDRICPPCCRRAGFARRHKDQSPP